MARQAITSPRSTVFSSLVLCLRSIISRQRSATRPSAITLDSSSTSDSMDTVKEMPPGPPSPGSVPSSIKIAHVGHRRNSSGATASTIPFAEHGPTIDRSQTREAFIKKKSKNAGLRWPRIRRLFREPFSEFMGTFILIMFGDGVVAQVVLSNGEKGNYQSISWGWVRCASRTPGSVLRC